jgi:hypothetical protein
MITPLMGLSPSRGDLPPRGTSDLDSISSQNLVGTHTSSSSRSVDLFELRKKDIHGSNSSHDRPRYISHKVPKHIPWSGMGSGSPSPRVDLAELLRKKSVHGDGSNSHHHPKRESLIAPTPIQVPVPNTACSPEPITTINPLIGLRPLRGAPPPRSTSGIDASQSPDVVRTPSSSSPRMVDLGQGKKRKLTETT